MKQFFKYVFASMLGTLLLGVIFFFFILIMALSSKGKQFGVYEDSFLELPINNSLNDRAIEDPFEKAFGGEQVSLSLNKAIAAIKKAKTDNNIKGIYLNCGYLGAGFANLEELRNELIDFKKSKKKIFAYSEIYSEASYYLASIADSIYINPSGSLIFDGFDVSTPFFKGTLDKLGIEMQVFRGNNNKFKGAVEPFINTKFSDENRIQISRYVNNLYNHYIFKIGESTNIDTATLKNISSNMLIRNSFDAVKYKLAHRCVYEDEVKYQIKKVLKQNETDKLSLVSINKYIEHAEEEESGKNKIAIIYALGEIQSGKGDNETIGSETFSKNLIKAREDKNVKAIVLRINSPGGSALASEVMWREVELAKKVKPVIVSMGNVAASGGYYIACNADTIVAQPTTITGSIGVFGLLPNTQKLLNDKLGITIDHVNTGKYSSIGTPEKPLSDNEKEIIQGEVDRIYLNFKQRVSQGRNLSLDKVEEIAMGRVWTATDAKDIGLVDILGGMSKAIEIAAFKAGISKQYQLIYYPKPKSFIENFINNQDEIGAKLYNKEFSEFYKYYNQLKNIVSKKGIQMYMPYLFEIN